MDDRARRGLQHVVATHGPDVTEDVARFETLLKVACPEMPGEVAAIAGALASKVPQTLEDADPSMATSQLFDLLVDRLKDERKLSAEDAFWAVGSWAIALGVLTEAQVAATPAPQHGQDLRLTVELTTEEAEVGCRKELELHGKKGSFNFPAHTRAGQVFHVRGAGGKGVAGGTPGDLHVVVSVTAPERREPLTADWDLMTKIPAHVLQDHLAVPMRRDADGAVVVAMVDPNNLPAVDDLQMHYGRVRTVAGSEEEIRDVLAQLASRQRSTAAPGGPAGNIAPPPVGAHERPASAGGVPHGTMPPTYLAYSILATLFCSAGLISLILGIIAIVNSAQVTSRWQAGDHAGALQASNAARSYATSTLVVGLVLIGWAIVRFSMAMAMLRNLPTG